MVERKQTPPRWLWIVWVLVVLLIVGARAGDLAGDRGIANAVTGGLLLVAATVLIIVEIVMRQFLHRTLGGVDELAGFALAVGTAWSFGSVLLDKAHVRIDTVYSRFGDRGRAVADVIGLAANPTVPI